MIPRPTVLLAARLAAVLATGWAVRADSIPGLAAESAAVAESQPFRVAVAPSSTRVSLAKVRLTVGHLYLVEDRLVGEYTIDIPLQRSKNDRGVLCLVVPGSAPDLLRTGGTLRGQGFSAIPGQPIRRITAVVSPASGEGLRGRLLLTIQTGPRRTLRFETTYQPVGDPQPLSRARAEELFPQWKPWLRTPETLERTNPGPTAP